MPEIKNTAERKQYERRIIENIRRSSQRQQKKILAAVNIIKKRSP